MKTLVCSLLGTGLLTCIASIASAQNSQLTGLVKDKTEAVIPAAAVTLTNADTGTVLAARSSKAGFYVFAAILPGKYSLTGEAPGFAKTIIKDVKIDAAANVSQDIVLQVKSTSQAVNVESDPPSELTETTAAVSTVIDRPLIENMPLNGNSLQTLFELTPGVITNAGGSPGNGGGFSVDGQRPTSNNLTVDGVSGNIFTSATVGPSVMGSGIATSASGGTNGLLSVDAIEEFRMQTSSYSAEYGRTPGGQIEVKTRGGTNNFHGSLFENFRNQVMDAQDWFNGYDHLKQSPLRMNDFGGTFGGPILKKRLFLFLAQENLFLNQPQPPLTGDVPNAQARSVAAPVFQPYLNTYPLGNGGPDPTSPGSDIYTFSYSDIIRDSSTSARLDAELPHQMHAFLRVNDAPSYQLIPYATNSTQVNINIITSTSGWSWVLSPLMTNDLSVNYSSNDSTYEYAQVPRAFFTAAANFVNTSQTSALLFPANWFSIGGGGRPNYYSSRQFALCDNVTRLFGTHTLKAGVDIRRLLVPIYSSSFIELQTSYSSLQSPGTVDNLFYATYVNEPHIRALNTSLYVDDVWRINRRLTLDLGMRWEYNPPATAQAPGLLGMRGDVNDPSTITLANPGTALYKTRYNNIAPRLGFVYALRDDARFKTVVRGGGGTFFDTGQSTSGVQAAAQQYPYLETASMQSVDYSQINVSQLQLAAQGLPQSYITLIDPNLLSPRTYDWSLTVDQGLGVNTTLSASYIGNHGDKLLKENLYSGLSPALATDLYVYTNGEASSYNALQIQLRTRETRGINVLASYTFSHALDNGSSDFVSVGGYDQNYRSNSDNDIRQVVSAAVHYKPQGMSTAPFIKAMTHGWSFDTITLVQSAAPLSVIGYQPLANVNQVNQLADIVPGAQPVITDPTAPGHKRLNPEGFSTPPGTRDGTSPRNAYRLFGLTQWDMAASRTWSLWEQSKMTFRVDAFNIINHPSFGGVDTVYWSGGLNTFGEATASYAGAYGTTHAYSGGLNTVFSNGGARSIQLHLGLMF